MNHQVGTKWARLAQRGYYQRSTWWSLELGTFDLDYVSNLTEVMYKVYFRPPESRDQLNVTSKKHE